MDGDLRKFRREDQKKKALAKASKPRPRADRPPLLNLQQDPKNPWMSHAEFRLLHPPEY